MSKSSSVSVCLLEPSSRSIARKRALLRMTRVNSNNTIISLHLISSTLFLFRKNYDTIIRNSRQNPRRKTTWRKNGFGTLELYPEE